jgi:alkanesulfonate monooxygenase SsuD/methylene tetrahydromethanopterin reductase-like flavin-dependent oxidoreductase (luciferase family)
MNRIGRERGWPTFTWQQYEAQRTLQGAWFVGTPEEVATKILHLHELFGHDRFLLQLTVGTMPHAKVLRAIELLGHRGGTDRARGGRPPAAAVS